MANLCRFFYTVCFSFVLYFFLCYSTIVIDVGKNFQASALEWFPKYGLRRIDAVLLTHAHADGVFQSFLNGNCILNSLI